MILESERSGNCWAMWYHLATGAKLPHTLLAMPAWAVAQWPYIMWNEECLDEPGT